MSRSAADATRFTATGPYIRSKPSAPSPTPYRLPDERKFDPTLGSSPLAAAREKHETPRQKVERLRAEARAARIAQSTSRVDQMIEGGRKLANRAHRVMIYSLIAASGVCGALTIYSVVSLTLYNRRQRNLWLDRQLEELQSARLAYANGIATPEQLEILRNEKIGEIEKQKKQEAREQRLWNRAKRYLFDGLKREDVPVESPTKTILIIDGSLPTDKSAVLEALHAKENMASSTAIRKKTSGPSIQSAPSDEQLPTVEEAADAIEKQSGRSWIGWITGR